MKDHRDEKLDELLRSRRVEPASPDLAQRIILKAQRLPQKPILSLWQWVRQICEEFHLPKPAYMLAGALIVGMVIGFSLPGDASPDGADDLAGVQSAFLSDEAIL